MRSGRCRRMGGTHLARRPKGQEAEKETLAGGAKAATCAARASSRASEAAARVGRRPAEGDCEGEGECECEGGAWDRRRIAGVMGEFRAFQPTGAFLELTEVVRGGEMSLPGRTPAY